MASALDSRLNDPGSVLCPWARNFTLTVPLPTQVNKWVPVKLMLVVFLPWTKASLSHPEGSNTIPSSFMLWKPEISAGMMGH